MSQGRGVVLQAFAGALATARERAGMSQKAIGGLLGVTQQLVGSWEQGLRSPAPEMVCQLEVILSVAPGTLTKHLGYLPLNAAKVIEHGVIDAVLSDPDLSDAQRRALLATYREFTRS
jgi:transcriptional regulator with XRE-family HTH domain